MYITFGLLESNHPKLHTKGRQGIICLVWTNTLLLDRNDTSEYYRSQILYCSGLYLLSVTLGLLLATLGYWSWEQTSFEAIQSVSAKLLPERNSHMK